jgi:hypothetical protein
MRSWWSFYRNRVSSRVPWEYIYDYSRGQNKWETMKSLWYFQSASATLQNITL